MEAPEGEINKAKSNKRRNHRGGQKKRGKKGGKGRQPGDQHTVTENKDAGTVVEARDDAVRADSGEGSNETQDLCSYHPNYTPHSINPMQVSGTSTKLYEIKEAAGKGLGVFAVQGLKRGTRIMCEPPLIHITRKNLMDVPAEFAKLSPDKQALLHSLSCRQLTAQDDARTSIIRVQQGLGASAAALSVEEHVKILAIFETNAFEADEGSVLCPEASRINHSCLPNVHHCWNNTIGRETVHAVKDIAAGEEILTTYVGICIDRAERENQLSRYGFSCDCPACDVSTTFGRASEKRRKHLFPIDQNLAMHGTLPMLSPFKNDREALAAVLEIAELLRQEGLENMELTRACVGLFHFISDGVNQC